MTIGEYTASVKSGDGTLPVNPNFLVRADPLTARSRAAARG